MSAYATGALSEQDLLAHFQKVKQAGRDKWMARCPAHDDQTPSLSISRGGKGWLLHCHAGCTFDAVLAAAILETGDLFDEPPRAKTSTLGKVDTIYDYVDEAGGPLFQVVRYKQPKGFRQRRSDGNGDYIWNLNGTRRVPYRLPKLLEAVADNKAVYIVEGEKDVHALEQLGLVATTCPGGVGKWQNAYADSLRGARVAIIADADKPGREHALDVYRSLATVAKKVELYEPAEGKDVSDHLAAGRSLNDLVAIKPEGLPAGSNNGATPTTNDSGIVWDTLDNIAVKPIRFADKPLLQYAAFHLAAGTKGSGKSTILSGVAAKFTRGEFGPKRRVVWITTEDSPGTDIRPRIEAAGGNPKLVSIVRKGRIKLPEHIDEIKRRAAELGDVGLIVLDPVSSTLASGKKSNLDTDVREALEPLGQLADELDCVIIGVRHIGKDRTRGALASVLGSVEWVNVPRAVLLVAPDDNDPSIRHIQVVAGNRVPPNESGRSYRIVGTLLPQHPEITEEVTRADEIGVSDKDVEDLLAHQLPKGGGQKSEALQELILGQLATGEKSRKYINQVCKDELGSNPDSVYKYGLTPLREAGEIKAHKEGFNADWFWELEA